MRTQGGYRFSLQFAADTEEQKRAGEFLERMGNRKSAIIVEALMTYLDANPKYESADAAPSITLNIYSHANQEAQLRANKSLEMALYKNA